MHPSVMAWAEQMLAKHGLDAGDVLEVGAFDVNGSVRPLFRRALSYLGTDAREGPGVDVVVDIESPVLTGQTALFDLVISTEMLEHTPHPWVAVTNMAQLIRPGGHLLLTTRGPGFGIHDHPGDYFRFTTSAMRLLVEEAGLTVRELCDDPEYPGVFVLAQR